MVCTQQLGDTQNISLEEAGRGVADREIDRNVVKIEWENVQVHVVINVTWDQEVLSARGFKSVGRHSEYSMRASIGEFQGVHANSLPPCIFLTFSLDPTLICVHAPHAPRGGVQQREFVLCPICKHKHYSQQ
jgi:hypothetical protein